MAIKLSDCLIRENVLFEVEASNRDEVLARLVKRLEETKDGFDSVAVIRALKEREAVLPTVIAPGVALPHARLERLAQPLVAIATTRKGIVFDPGKDPVHLILLVLTPESDPSAHLRILAMLTTALKGMNAANFISSATVEDVFALFTSGTDDQTRVLLVSDVMNNRPVTLLESDTLNEAISTFCSRNILDISVIDEDGDLRGVLSVEDLLRQSLPPHLLWMENLTPIINFEPFAEMIKKDRETKLADVLREDYVSVTSSAPAVQLAKIFLMKPVRQIQVVDGRRLIGVVDLGGYSTKLFWA
jgi:nitrogen PTS system EIIA component